MKTPTQQPFPVEIAFVFSNVSNHAELAAAFRPGVEVYVLDGTQDGLAQMAGILEGRSGISALHIVGHGAAGQIRLGSVTLDSAGVAVHGEALGVIGGALTDDGDIRLYGCDVATDLAGTQFVARLAQATGADVAASTDNTGGVALGGDWILEYEHGAIGSTDAFDTAAVASLNSLLAIPSAGVKDITSSMDVGTFVPGFTLGVSAGDSYVSSPAAGADPDGIYFYSTGDQATANIEGTMTVTADNVNLGSFDLTGLGIVKYSGTADGAYNFTLTGYKPDGSTVTSTFSNPHGTTGFSGGPDFSAFTGIVKYTLRINSATFVTMDPPFDPPQTLYPVSNWTFDSFTIANPHGPNVVSVFLGGSALNAVQNGGAVSVSSLLHVNDVDNYQTLTWSQQSAPAHGTLTFSGATAAGGSSNVTPGGTITYTPTTGYVGTDSFTVRVYDGFQAVTKTISVTVGPATPTTPDLAGAMDTGTSSTDNITRNGFLTFTGTGATGDSTSTVRVFLDVNGNGAYDAGTDATATAVMSNGSWTVSNLNVLSVADGSYNAYAYTTSSAANGSLVGSLSGALGVTLDKTAPTLAITSNRSTLKAGETATITFTFSEDPGSTFASGDVTVSGGVLGALSGSGLTRTATFTPTANQDGGAASITVASSLFADAAGNSGGAGSTPSLTFDTKVPTLTISSSVSTLNIGDTATITFTFSEDPGASFTVSDVTVSGGTLGPLSGSGTTRTATFTPTPNTNNGVASVSVASGLYTDAAGNPGDAGPAPGITFDTLAPSAPTLALSAGSDTGTSSSDLVTSDTTPTITGTSEAGATVALYDTDGVTLLGSTTADGSGNWSITTGTLSAGTHSLTTRATDAAGNLGSHSAPISLSLDTVAPTVSITSSTGTLLVGQTATITFTFSEDPGASFIDSDISVTGGTLGALSGTGTTRTAVFTPDDNSVGTASITIASGNYADAAGNSGGAGITPTLTYDTTAPTVAITSSAPVLKAGETATITFAFSADPGATFTDSDVLVSGGTLSTITGSGLTRTATFTPGADTQSGSASITIAAGAYEDGGGKAGLAGTSPSITFDTLVPTLAITSDAAALKVGETATITFTFSEDPGASFVAGDIVVSGGTLGALSGTGATRTATFTPTAGTNGGTASITVAAGTYADAAGNNGEAAATPALVFDTLAPADSSPDLAQASDTGVSDSDDITTDTTPTITGTAEDGATVTLYNGATVMGTAVASGGAWSITTGELSQGAYFLSTTVTDAAGNLSPGASGTVPLIIDTTAPTLAITSSVAALKVGETATITFTFSENPNTTFTLDDVVVTGGTLSTLSGIGNTRTATFTPTADTNGGTASITVANGLFTDRAGNAGGGGTTPALVFDTLAPGLSNPDLAPESDLGFSSSDNMTADATPTFNGTAEDGATVELYYGLTLLGSTTATGGTWSITSGSALPEGSHTLTTKVIDAAGNVSTGGATVVLVETTAPTLAITSDVSTLKAGESATITFTFSEDPGATFNAGDITVTGGALGALSGSGTTRTATFTPSADTNAGTASITVASGVYTDEVGNGGGAGGTPTMTFDTLVPTVTITSDAAVLKVGETATITFTFSEDPGASFDASDIVVSGGTLGTLTGSGTVWSATFTPDANTNGGSGAVSIASGLYADAAGNGGAAGATPSLTFDTLAPAAPSAPDLVSASDSGASDSDGVTSATTPVITGTAEDGATVTLYDGATVIGTAVAMGGTWSITSSALAAGAHSLTATVTDSAGNVSAASAALGITIDTSAPVLSITSDASALKAGETATITFTFSEDPGSTFDASDISVSGGSLGALSGTGLTRTATFTPAADTGSGSASITVAAGAYADAAGNAGGAGTTPSLAIDTRIPSVAITSDVAELKVGEVATITFTFSEDPGPSFTDSDVTVTGGTLGALSGTGTTRTATFTPTASTNGGVATIAIAAGAYNDAAGNGGAAGVTPALTFDTLAPPASPAPDLDVGSDTGTSGTDNLTSDSTPTFTGTAEDGATVTLYDGATVIGAGTATGGSWSITSAALGEGAHSVSAVVTDAAGNVSPASAALVLSVDTVAPSLAITSDTAFLKIGEVATITFTFSEDPGATFTADDITVTGGTLGALSGTGATRTATFTPAANSNGGTAGISVASGLYNDAAGNAGGAGVTPSLTFDTYAPSATDAPDLAPESDSGTSASDDITSDTTPTFTGTAEDGATVTLYDGATIVGTAVAAGGTWSITSSVLSAGAHALSTTVTDAAGNVSAASPARNVTIDTATPALAITSDVSTLKAGESATVTFTFSEDPGATFDTGDIVVSGGTLGAPSGAGLTRTATFTPSPGANGSGSITVASGAYTDAAGNAGGAGASPVLSFDTLAPTVAITSNVTGLKIGETATITFTFSEDPAATFTLADIDVAGGTLDTLSGTGLVRTAIFTPAGGVNGGTATIAIAAGLYADTAGNAGTAGSAPALTFDTLAPDASSTPDLAAESDSGTSASDNITADTTPTFTGTAEDGATVTLYDGASIVGTAVATGGAWSITSTALAEGAHALATTVTDAAGNVSSASAAVNITIDTSAPAASIPDLAAASDSGESGIDDVTFDSTPAFTGSAEDGATVTLYEGATVLGTAVASGGAWSITSAALADGVHLVTTVVTDAAGNASAVSVPLALTVDTVGPALTIAGDVAALKAGATATVTFTFSEDPGASFSASDIVVAGGTLSALSGTGASRTATFTPSADSTGSASVSVAAGTYTDAAGNTGAAASMPAIPIDTLAPTITISSDRAALKAGQTATITFTFSEDPGASFTAADVAITGGTLGELAGSGTIRTATFTPDAGTNGGVASIAVAAGAYTDAAGNDGAAGVAPVLTFDTHIPAESAAPDMATADDSGSSDTDNITSDTTPTFTGSAEDGATVSLYDGATLVGTAVAAGGSWTITSSALSSGTHAMTAVVSDAAGNASAPSAALSVTVDTGAPTVAITSSASALRAGQTATITLTFSEDPGATFTAADLAVTGGTIGALSGTGPVRTATFTPAADSNGATATISLAAGLYADAAGNTGAAATLPIAVDTSAPASPAPVLLHDSGTSGDRITNSGAVQVSGIEAGATWEYSTNGGASWQAGTGSQLTLSGDGVRALLVRQTDSAGNTGPASAPLVFTLDTQGPAASVSISDSSLTTGETATVTVRFDEPVDDFSLSDITAPFGMLSGLSSSDGGQTWTATYTPDVGALTPAASIVVSNAGVSDAAGNTGSGSSTSGQFSVQTAGIGASIQMSDTELLAGETAQVTIVFNEAVTGFTGADLAAGNGTLSNLSSSDGGKTWTATLTPTVSAADASNVITLDYSGVFGQAGLPGIGTGTSGSYSVNTVRPTAMLSLADRMLAPGEATEVTITFSEPVAGFSFADLTVLSGTLSGLSSADGGRTWTTILTADQGTANMGGIALNAAGVHSLAGNSGTGVVAAKFYTIPASATPASVDGADAYYQHTVGSNGTPGQVVMVLPTTPDRTDDPSSPNGGLADIPLGVASSEGNSLMVGLPAGTGLQANGPLAALSQPQALQDLIQRIESTQQGPARQEMAGHGSSFLGSLAEGITVESRTLTLTAEPGANPGAPIVITGAAAGQGSVAGLVIDGSGLPSGSTLQLDNVEFAAVIGDMRLVGGAGRNYVVGDSGAQTIYLGAEDDAIFGGAGKDIIGSAGGDDLLDGGSGDDLVAGGIGNDRLQGGDGNDILNGGRSVTGGWDFYLAADGSISARHTGAALTLTGSELVAAAEFDHAATELAFLGAHAAQLEGVALLYAALGRAPDVAGLSFWSRTGVVSLRDVADGVLRSAEWGSTPLGQAGDAEFVRGMYRDLLGREVDDAGLAFWTANMSAGRANRSDVLMAVAFSGEHKDKALTGDGYLIAHASLSQERGWISASGDDRLDGGAGNDLLVGGDGFDTAVYAGRIADYDFVVGSDGLLRVVHLATGDTDILNGIESAEFTDGSLELASLVGQVGPSGT